MEYLVEVVRSHENGVAKLRKLKTMLKYLEDYPFLCQQGLDKSFEVLSVLYLDKEIHYKLLSGKGKLDVLVELAEIEELLEDLLCEELTQEGYDEYADYTERMIAVSKVITEFIYSYKPPVGKKTKILLSNSKNSIRQMYLSKDNNLEFYGREISKNEPYFEVVKYLKKSADGIEELDLAKDVVWDSISDFLKEKYGLTQWVINEKYEK